MEYSIFAEATVDKSTISDVLQFLKDASFPTLIILSIVVIVISYIYINKKVGDSKKGSERSSDKKSTEKTGQEKYIDMMSQNLNDLQAVIMKGGMETLKKVEIVDKDVTNLKNNIDAGIARIEKRIDDIENKGEMNKDAFIKSMDEVKHALHSVREAVIVLVSIVSENPSEILNMLEQPKEDKK